MVSWIAYICAALQITVRPDYSWIYLKWPSAAR
jgi:hypothetical protein